MTSAKPLSIVLAAGSSRRLWPLGDKALINLAGQSLLERHLRLLAQIGSEQILVVASSANEASIRQITAALDPAIVVIVQHSPIGGMAGAVLSVHDALGADSVGQAVYITHPHGSPNLLLHAGVLAASRLSGGIGVLAARPIAPDDYFPGGYLVTEGSGEQCRVRAILEKPGPDAVPSGRLATIVAHVHPDLAALASAIGAAAVAAAPGADDLYEQAVSTLCATNEYCVFEHHGPWHPLKYPWQLLEVMAESLAQIRTGSQEAAQIEEGASIVGPVVLGAGARVLHGAQIVGPAWIGPGALIGQFVSLRASIVGASAIIGVGSEINRSYIGAGSKMHGARILDSILVDSVAGDRPTNIGAGTISANLRIDGGEVRSAIEGRPMGTGRRKLGAIIGPGAFVSINAGLMPGVKLGAGSVVYPGTTLYRDLPDGGQAGRRGLRQDPE
jgi:bifunctional UDP-N-acetylglucosamine pyrophosphorylase/glucosamine-1-phosphate N-acetyltransferase